MADDDTRLDQVEVVADEGTEAVRTEELLIEEVSIDGMCGVY